MTQAFRLATGHNVSLRIDQPLAAVDLSDPAYFKVFGGANGEVLVSDGAGGFVWAIPSVGGGGISEAPSNNVAYGRENAAWVQVLKTTDVIDGGRY